MATNKELAKSIIELIGGKQNVIAATNCMTRLRIRLKDVSKVKMEELKDIEGVLGVTGSDTLQVVVGPGKAKKIADIFVEDYGIAQDSAMEEDWQENKKSMKAQQKKGPIKTGLETIAGIFIRFASLISTLQGNGNLPASNVWNFIQLMFALIGASFLGYFAIFTGVNAAKRFGATEALGGMIGAMTIGAQINGISTIFGLFNEAVPLDSILTTGKGGIIGVIFGVWLLSKIEKRVRKIVPDVLDLILTPLISLLVTGLALVLIIMPVSGLVSDLLIKVLSVIINSDNTIVSIISGYVLSALFLPMVLLGLHHGLIPIYAIQLESMGGVTLFPVLAMAGAGQVGAAIAIYFKAKKVDNKRMQSVITGALPAGILGIGEPLIYGVTLPLGKPFITAGLGAGFGGAYVMATKVMATAWGPSGLVAIPLMQPSSMLNYFIGILISYIGGVIMTNLFIKTSDVDTRGVSVTNA